MKPDYKPIILNARQFFAKSFDKDCFYLKIKLFYYLIIIRVGMKIG